MKKIALIMDGWKRFFTYAWPAGVLERIRETNEDVNLYIFNSSGDWSRDEDYNIGEYNIYRLPDLNDFDGIIVDLNNIRYPKVREYVISSAKATGKPVISIANEIEDFYYVGINNEKAMRMMIEHLYEKHGCKKYWFVMGPEDNYENVKRIAALRAYMDEKQLTYSESDFYCESFEYQCGVNGFEKLLETHDKGRLPQAIICGNDNIAVGVCEAATAHGYQVPKDFCVTGFDNFDKAAYYEPRISTISHIRENVGIACVDLFLHIWKGEKPDRFYYTDTEGIFWDSCGCMPGEVPDQAEYLKGQVMYGIETARFEDEVFSLEYELLKCNTVREMMYCIPQCIPSLKCDAMYLILDSHMDTYKEQVKTHRSLSFFEEEDFHVEGYPKCMQVKFAYKNGKMLDTDQMEIEGIFPFFEPQKGGTDFLFLPMHFRNRTVGYFVIENAVYLMEKQYLFQVIKTLTNAMENLHKKEKLEHMNQILSDLYVRDSVTGLYNRMGYQKLSISYFTIMREKKMPVLVMFIDLDRLKYINDTFGHEYGDFAIVSIAKAMLKHCDADAIAARTGGDEFIVLEGAKDEESGRVLAQKIRTELSKTQRAMQLPFDLSASIGAVVAHPGEENVLESYVKRAEMLMYEEKAEKKVSRDS